MNLLGLVTFLRTNLLDDRGGIGVSWTTITENDDSAFQLRWTNEELVSNINEAILQVYRRTSPIKDIMSLALTGNVDTYLLPSHITKITLVKREDDKSVTEKSLDEVWNLPRKTGEVLYYSTDINTNNIRFYPVPAIAQNLTLLVYRDPILPLSWTSPTDTPELRAAYHIPMLNYAAYLSYLKDEANANDPNRAAIFLDKFDREFPPTSVYSQIRKSRTSNRSIKYLGG